MNTKEYLQSCDARFRAELFAVADAIAKGSERVVCLSGPTCSGKTTAAAMLAQRIRADGRKIHIISIDDFYFDRDYLHELSRKKGFDGIDYDSADTIDLFALGEFVREALTGEEIHCPVFDFKTGMRSGYRTVSAKEDDLFIFEGIQAIYPQVTELFRAIGYVSVYIAPLRSLTLDGETFEPNEIRLLRRIVRDSNFRNTYPDVTFSLWANVRANEDKNIFPYVKECKYRIDSTHDYELGVLKPFLERILPTVPFESGNKALADGILCQISSAQSIDPSLVEADSLYKEFV